MRSDPAVAPSRHALAFTSHNVRLDDGSLTYPRAGRTLDETANFSCVKRILPLLFPDGWRGKSIADLGCLEGGFTTEFARLGLDAVGIDVRPSNIANAEYIRAHTDLPNLRFICDDAWNVGRHGPFDLVFCVGLHYHIQDQRRFLKEIGRAARKALFLDTFVAPVRDDAPAVSIYKLSALTEHEGLPGRWFAEHDLDARAQTAELDQLKWASWDNRRSFWPTRAALVRSMCEAGFDVVVEDASQIAAGLAPGSPEAERYRRSRRVFWGFKA